MKNFIEVYDNALSTEACEKIKTFADFMCTKEGAVRTSKGIRVDENKKSSYDYRVNFNSESEVSNLVQKALIESIEKYKIKHNQINLISYWSFDNIFNLQKYYPNQGYYQLHCENSSVNDCKRIGAWMIYLNTVSDGGGTYFDNYDLTLDAKQGRCVIWPAYWTHFHKGVVSKTETKYIATGWITFIDNV